MIDDLGCCAVSESGAESLLLCNYVNRCLNLCRKERVQEAFVLQLDRGIQVVNSASIEVVIT